MDEWRTVATYAQCHDLDFNSSRAPEAIRKQKKNITISTINMLIILQGIEAAIAQMNKCRACAE